MGQAYYSDHSRYSNSYPRRTRARRRSTHAGARFAVVSFLGVGAFACGFVALWFLGSLIVGGQGSDGRSAGMSATGGLLVPVRSEYEVEPAVDLLALRDLAYVPVKGVHVTSAKASDIASMGRIMDLIDRTELNAMVVAIKDDYGRIAYDSKAAMAEAYRTVKPMIWGGDIDALLSTLAQRNIIPIARIVCFKDDYLTAARPDLAIQSSEGGMWVDNKGHRYLNPYNHEVWEYIVQVAEDAARRGFREIQFDYIRFPANDDGDLSLAEYPGRYCSKEDVISQFLAYARPRLEALGVWVSADVFGHVVDRIGDQGIGQNLEMLCRNVDVICPMVYPNLYEPGEYGLEYPAAKPYELVKNALVEAPGRLAGTGAKGRPYLQAFDDYYARSLDYTAEMVRAQINAAAELGFTEYILWGGYPDLGPEVV